MSNAERLANMGPVNLLALDGGGIRGVSELIILDEIMKRIQHDMKLTDLPRPCDYFNLIGGTSTGGRIAIMLGRLQMSTKEALEEYRAIAGQIFSAKNKKWVVVDGAFKATTLEQEIKRVVATRTSDNGGNERMLDIPNQDGMGAA
ncbi:MAG: hypothetical protein M1839_001251 [Geoglossum umbratile]|nr:MAG: hypothetical protein M1839_001251 [Geoglossum umbratile]